MRVDRVPPPTGRAHPGEVLTARPSWQMWFEKFKTKFRKDKDYLTRPSSTM